MDEQIKALKEGKSIVIQLSTGLFEICNARNAEAVDTICENCPDPMQKRVFVDKLMLIERHAPEFHPICYDLIDTATRPLTIIYPHFDKLAVHCSVDDKRVAIRLIENGTMSRLVKAVHGPLFGVPLANATNLEIIEVEKGKAKEQVISIGLGGEVAIIRP